MEFTQAEFVCKNARALGIEALSNKLGSALVSFRLADAVCCFTTSPLFSVHTWYLYP